LLLGASSLNCQETLSVFRNSIAILFLSLPLVGACTESPVEDELAGESAADDGVAGKADSPNALETFYTVRQDIRRCASPMCGGWFVSRVNHAKTRCNDGVLRDECYVWNFDTTALGLTGRELDGFYMTLFAHNGIVRGDISTQNVVEHDVGLFTATEAWQGIAAAGAPGDGVWVEAYDNGTRCIQAPCNSITEDKLNSVLSADIANIDFAPSGATDGEMEKAWDALDGDGLIVVGDRYYGTKNHKTYKGRTAQQFYAKMQPSAPTGE